MRWRLIAANRAKRSLKRLPERDKERLVEALDELAINPRNIKVKDLNPGSTEFSMRIGSYRILFDLLDDHHLIVVQRIERRSSTTYR